MATIDPQLELALPTPRLLDDGHTSSANRIASIPQQGIWSHERVIEALAEELYEMRHVLANAMEYHIYDKHDDRSAHKDDLFHSALNETDELLDALCQDFPHLNLSFADL